MDQRYTDAVTTVLENVFETMLRTPIRIEPPESRQGPGPLHDVSGIISISGEVEGALSLSFPVETAERVVSELAQEPLDQTHDDFADAVGELVNMVCGGAKARFGVETLSISCPTVVVGNNHNMWPSKDMETVVIRCDCDLGEFAVELAIKKQAYTSEAA